MHVIPYSSPFLTTYMQVSMSPFDVPLAVIEGGRVLTILASYDLVLKGQTNDLIPCGYIFFLFNQ